MPNATLYAGPALVTLATSLLLFFCAAHVGRMRGRHRIDAPAVSGHRELEIALRIHANTVENAVLFLPALWICAVWLSATWASVFGATWLAARIGYAFAYAADPKKRGGGFALSMLAFGAAGLGGAWGVLRSMLAG